MKIIEYMCPVKTIFSIAFRTHVIHNSAHFIITEIKDSGNEYIGPEALVFFSDEHGNIDNWTSILSAHDTPGALAELELITVGDIDDHYAPLVESEETTTENSYVNTDEMIHGREPTRSS